MTAPNIGTIAASLRSCSLGGEGGAEQSLPRPHLVGAGGESDAGITVELISDAALPYHREQCLDMLFAVCLGFCRSINKASHLITRCELSFG